MGTFEKIDQRKTTYIFIYQTAKMSWAVNAEGQKTLKHWTNLREKKQYWISLLIVLQGLDWLWRRKFSCLCAFKKREQSSSLWKSDCATVLTQRSSSLLWILWLLAWEALPEEAPGPAEVQGGGVHHLLPLELIQRLQKRNQGVIRRCRLSLLTNSALVYISSPRGLSQ